MGMDMARFWRSSAMARRSVPLTMTAELSIPGDLPWIEKRGCCCSTAAAIGYWHSVQTGSGRGRRLRFYEGRVPGYHSAIPAVEWAGASVLPVTQVIVMSEVTSVSAPRGGLMLSGRCCFAASRVIQELIGSSRRVLHFVLGPGRGMIGELGIERLVSHPNW
jgi:hypothetical protein